MGRLSVFVKPDSNLRALEKKRAQSASAGQATARLPGGSFAVRENCYLM